MDAVEHFSESTAAHLEGIVGAEKGREGLIWKYDLPFSIQDGTGSGNCVEQLPDYRVVRQIFEIGNDLLPGSPL
jgi:hypothetical protein